MALGDWLWLIRLIMEILKLIAQLPEDELKAIATLRKHIPEFDTPQEKPSKGKTTTT